MLDLEGLHLRAALFSSIREFFTDRDFLEVDTPLRQPVLIPENNITWLTAEKKYLQSSPEQGMKRLLARGCENIFQICPCFRKNEIGRVHLEEFSMLEWYRSGADYRQLMADCDDLIRHVVSRIRVQVPPGSACYNSPLLSDVDLLAGCDHLSVTEAFTRYAPQSLEQALVNDSFDEMLVTYIEPFLGQKRPLILYDYPIELASLARPKPEDPRLAERFELYIAGLELANGFSELTDPQVQRKRFSSELALIEKGQGKQFEMPEKFLSDLANIESAAGIALGIDRLFMLILGKNSIDQVVTFSPDDL